MVDQINNRVNIGGRRAGKSLESGLKLAAYIQKNVGKPFTIGTAEGVYAYSAQFTSHEEMAKERQSKDDFKAMFIPWGGNG